MVNVYEVTGTQESQTQCILEPHNDGMVVVERLGSIPAKTSVAKD